MTKFQAALRTRTFEIGVNVRGGLTGEAFGIGDDQEAKALQISGLVVVPSGAKYSASAKAASEVMPMKVLRAMWIELVMWMGGNLLERADGR